jgi:hypothetical protein
MANTQNHTCITHTNTYSYIYTQKHIFLCKQYTNTHTIIHIYTNTRLTHKLTPVHSHTDPYSRLTRRQVWSMRAMGMSRFQEAKFPLTFRLRTASRVLGLSRVSLLEWVWQFPVGLFLVQNMDSSSCLSSLLSKSKSRCHHSTKQQGSEPCNHRIPHKVKEVKHGKDLSDDPAAGESPEKASLQRWKEGQ